MPICPICQQEFYSTDRNKKICINCRQLYFKARDRLRQRNPNFDSLPMDKQRDSAIELAKRRFSGLDRKRGCKLCGKLFYPAYPTQAFCSKTCFKQARAKRRRRQYIYPKDTTVPLNDIAKAANDCGLDYGSYRAYLNAGYSHDQIKSRFGRCAT